MHPRPMAETDGPCVPSVRYSMVTATPVRERESARPSLAPDVADDRDDPVGPGVDHDQVVAGEIALVVRRNSRKAPDERRGHRHQPLLQSGRQRTVLVQLLAQAGGQRFPLGEARRQRPGVRVLPDDADMAGAVDDDRGVVLRAVLAVLVVLLVRLVLCLVLCFVLWLP